MHTIQLAEPCTGSPGTSDHPEQRPAPALNNLYINSVDPRPPRRATSPSSLPAQSTPSIAPSVSAPPKPTNPQPSSGPKNTLTCLRYHSRAPRHSDPPQNHPRLAPVAIPREQPAHDPHHAPAARSEQLPEDRPTYVPSSACTSLRKAARNAKAKSVAVAKPQSPDSKSPSPRGMGDIPRYPDDPDELGLL